MAGLPWVRLDSNFYSHDKVLELLDDPSTKKWQAISVYVFALGWAAGHGTDGKIGRSALGMVHGSPQIARLLVKYRLWDEDLNGWQIRNYSDRQQLSDETYTVRKSQSVGGKKGACKRYHVAGCECWKEP